MLKNFFEKYKWLILTTTFLFAGSLLFVGQSWIHGQYFVGGGDVKTQWFPFYILCRRAIVNAIKTKTFPFYSWVLFLGNNIWASKSSYGMFDIYNILSISIDGNYFKIYDILCIARILVGGISCYALIKYIFKNDKVSLIAGVLYGLSSYSIYFTAEPGFQSFYSLVPLYFLGMEMYLNKKGKYLFIFSVFVMLLMNFYLFYALSVFSPVYFIYRYYLTRRNLKGVVLSALKLIGYYLIGVLLSGFIIVPAFMYVIQNSRVGHVMPLTYSELNIYLHMFFAPFIPNQLYIYKNNIFDHISHNIKEVCLFSGTVCSLLVPQILRVKDKLFKKATIIVYAIMMVILFVPLASSAVNGFSDPCFRWSFFFILMNIMTASYFLVNPKVINPKLLELTLVIEGVLVLTAFGLALADKGKSLIDFITQFKIIILVILSMTVCGYLIKTNNKFLHLFICLEMLVLCFANGNNQDGLTEKDVYDATNVLADNSNPSELMDYLNGLDDINNYQYFRTYIPYESLYWYFSHDLSVIYNVNDLMSYDSMYAPSFQKMKTIDYEGVVNIIDWEYDIKNPDIIQFLSTKYSITVSEDEIPFSDYEIVDTTFRESLLVAENKNYRPLITTYTKYISYDDFYNSGKDASALNGYVISDVDVSSSLGKTVSSVEGVIYYDNYLFGTLNTDDKGFAVMSLPYDKGWEITINGNRTNYVECNGGMIGFEVNEGKNDIEMYFTPDGFKTGCLFTTLGALSLMGVVIFDIISKKKNN